MCCRPAKFVRCKIALLQRTPHQVPNLNDLTADMNWYSLCCRFTLCVVKTPLRVAKLVFDLWPIKTSIVHRGSIGIADHDTCRITSENRLLEMIIVF